MIKRLRKFSLRKAGICSAAIGSVNIVVHLLVISQVIPYVWVNGGRTLSYAAARETAVWSIVMTLLNILIALIASQIIPLRMNRFFSIFLSVFLIATLPFGFLGIIQQLIGTTFEKCVMSIVTLIGFCADVRIAFEKRW